ncbi:hypothetical protein ACP70R_026496 [Stipagrostis hirtigluma subsp. patula]
MAAPTVAADTAAPPPPPPPAEPGATAVPDQKVSIPTPPPPQPDAPAPAPAPPTAPAPKKRKLDEVGFHTSDYYKIRAIVADLRVHFVQVYEATNFRNSDAAREILKEMKVVMELSKKMRLCLGATSVPAKPFEKPPAAPVKDEHVKPSEKPSDVIVKDEPVKPSEKPSAEPVKDEPVKPSENSSAEPVKDEPVKPSEEPSAEPVKDEPVKPSEEPSAEPVKDDTGPTPPAANTQAPQVVQTAVPPNNVSDDVPIKHDNSQHSSEGDKGNPTQ